MRFLVVGEINADLILESVAPFPALGREVRAEDGRLVLGSSSAIAAAGLAKLGETVGFVGEIGDDPLGRFCLDEMRGLAIDVGRVRVRSDRTTGVTVSITAGIDRALVTYPGAAEDFAITEIPEGFDHLHVASPFLQNALRPVLGGLFREAHRRGLTTSLDPGHDPSGRWEIGDVLQEVDVLLPNERELVALGRRGDRLAAARTLRPATVAVKLGAEGAAAIASDAIVEVGAPKVAVRDTTGAGDSFDAGFLHAWVRRRQLVDCLRYGVTAGSLSTRELGGTAAQPSLEELEAFMTRNGR